MFAIIDGIDGAGKSSIMDFWAKNLEQKGKKIFYLKKYWNEFHRHPEPKDLEEYDVLFSAEPTSAWIGSAIREEMIKNDRGYSTEDTAYAYSLDRLILYRRILLPFLAMENKIILQDRSVSTSLCYQSIQGGLSLEKIAALPGNDFALKHAPNILIIADLPAQTAITRLSGRADKKDDSIFEKISFLEKARAFFLSEQFQNIFTSRGAEIKILNCDQNFDKMNEDAADILFSRLKI